MLYQFFIDRYDSQDMYVSDLGACILGLRNQLKGLWLHVPKLLIHITFPDINTPRIYQNGKGNCQTGSRINQPHFKTTRQFCRYVPIPFPSHSLIGADLKHYRCSILLPPYLMENLDTEREI